MGKAERTLKRLLKEGKDVDLDDEGPPPLSPRTKLLNEQREALTGLTDMLSHEAFNAFLRRGGKVDALETLERWLGGLAAVAVYEVGDTRLARDGDHISRGDCSGVDASDRRRRQPGVAEDAMPSRMAAEADL